MEKAQKGLFGRMLDFWRERIGENEMGGIGFWDDSKDGKRNFAKMADAAALQRQEKKRSFWEKPAVEKEEKASAETLLERQKRFLQTQTDAEGKKETASFAETERREKKQRAKLFSAEILRENKGAEEKEGTMGAAFFTEAEEEKGEKRNVIPVFTERERETDVYEAEEKRIFAGEIHKKEEGQREPVVDVEKLMCQMTKKLWEERESCGRRLR